MMYISRQEQTSMVRRFELKAEAAGITPKEYVDNDCRRSKSNLGSDECIL